jgi:predicted metal-binding protein
MTALSGNEPFIICARCGHAMNLIRTVPKYREFAELSVFVCSSCGEVQTKEAQPATCLGDAALTRSTCRPTRPE